MISEQNTVVVRRATISDSALLLAWRNDPITRQMFVDQKEVSLEEHRIWLDETLRREDRILLIGENCDQQPIGVVRFDIDHRRSSAEISITIAPGARGHGFAAKLLCSAIRHFRSEPNVRVVRAKLLARIRRANAASIASFRRVGFSVSREDPEYVHLVLV